ncbi:40492_t:CDS:1, partial [Gigaspora margarita]
MNNSASANMSNPTDSHDKTVNMNNSMDNYSEPVDINNNYNIDDYDFDNILLSNDSASTSFVLESPITNFDTSSINSTTTSSVSQTN